jgi:hypothetical protein
MREVQAIFGPGEKGNSRPRPRFRPGRGERGRQPRPWAGFGSRTRAGPTKRNGPRAKISSTAPNGPRAKHGCCWAAPRAHVQGQPDGLDAGPVQRERKEAPLGQACWTAGQCAWRPSGQNSKEKRNGSFLQKQFFYVSCLNLCRFLNQWDKIVRE